MSCSRSARRHDRVGAHLLSLNPGSIVAMDRAYNDYQLFAEWTAAGIFFVTRLKDNADYEVTDERRVRLGSAYNEVLEPQEALKLYLESREVSLERAEVLMKHAAELQREDLG